MITDSIYLGCQAYPEGEYGNFCQGRCPPSAAKREKTVSTGQPLHLDIYNIEKSFSYI